MKFGNESFDFSKQEDQKKFESLPDDKKEIALLKSYFEAESDNESRPEFSPKIETTICGVRAEVRPNGIKMTKKEMLRFIDELMANNVSSPFHDLAGCLEEAANDINTVESMIEEDNGVAKIKYKDGHIDDSCQYQSFPGAGVNMAMSSVGSNNFYLGTGFEEYVDGEIRPYIVINEGKNKRAIHILFTDEKNPLEKAEERVLSTISQEKKDIYSKKYDDITDEKEKAIHKEISEDIYDEYNSLKANYLDGAKKETE